MIRRVSRSFRSLFGNLHMAPLNCSAAGMGRAQGTRRENFTAVRGRASAAPGSRVVHRVVMHRLLTLLVLVSTLAQAETKTIGIAIGDFAYVDTSGEATDQAAVHVGQLKSFVADLRRDFERQGGYRLVALSCGSSCMDVELPELARAASAAGANIMIIGGVHKMSTLVQWARVEAIDVDTNRIILDRLFTFRGDNAQAWNRAEAFVFREVQAELAARGG